MARKAASFSGFDGTMNLNLNAQGHVWVSLSCCLNWARFSSSLGFMAVGLSMSKIGLSPSRAARRTGDSNFSRWNHLQKHVAPKTDKNASKSPVVKTLSPSKSPSHVDSATSSAHGSASQNNASPLTSTQKDGPCPHLDEKRTGRPKATRSISLGNDHS